MNVTVYGLVRRDDPIQALQLALEPFPGARNPSEGGEYTACTSQFWVVRAPEGARLEREESGRLVLAWELDGHAVRSDAQEVWSLARLGLQGFGLDDAPHA